MNDVNHVMVEDFIENHLPYIGGFPRGKVEELIRKAYEEDRDFVIHVQNETLVIPKANLSLWFNRPPQEPEVPTEPEAPKGAATKPTRAKTPAKPKYR